MLFSLPFNPYFAHTKRLSYLIIFLFIKPLYNYTFSNIYLLLLFYFPTTLYLNLTISLSLQLPFYFDSSSLHFFTIKNCYFLFDSIHILLTQKGEYSLSLSLSLYIYIHTLVTNLCNAWKCYWNIDLIFLLFYKE